jgi:hypothetical protein
MPFNADTLKEEIFVELGNNKMPVELSNEDLDVCIKRALEKYSMYKPLTISASYKSNIGQANSIEKYDLPAEVIGVRSVDMLPAVNGFILSGLQVENALINGVPVYLGAGDLSLDIDYLNIRRQWLKVTSRQLASDPTYEVVQDPETQLFSIYTFCTSPCFVEVKATAEYRSDLINIPHYNRYWFHKWVRMEAKKILGNIRSKYSHIPVAGGNMQLNGNELLAEAHNEELELLNELQSTRADLAPMWA